MTLEGLIRFHRESVAPDLERIAATLDQHTRLHHETHSHLDAIYYKLDRLEAEYHSIRAAVDRLERRMAMVEVRVEKLEERVSRVEDRAVAIEQALDHIVLGSELRELEERITQLERDIKALKDQI